MLEPGSPSYPTVHKYSITVAVRAGVSYNLMAGTQQFNYRMCNLLQEVVYAGNVPGSWIDPFKQYICNFCVAGAVSQEIGGRAQRIHLQACIQMRGLATEAFCKVLVNALLQSEP